MKTMDEVVVLTKRMLVKYGQLQPILLIEGTSGSDARPLPDAAEPIKLSLLEALGYTLAVDNTVGELQQLWLIAEGWASKATYHAGVSPTQPKHADDRQEVVLIFCYVGTGQAKGMTLYQTIRTATGEVRELQPWSGSIQQGKLEQSRPLEAFIAGFARGRRNRR